MRRGHGGRRRAGEGELRGSPRGTSVGGRGPSRRRAARAPAWRGLAVLAALLLGACSTTDRLWRISPLADEMEASPDRVNLWPLAYHDGEATSVLWPIFDVDDEGFAVRPVVARDGATWSVLWPWARYDTERDVGWAFPWYRIEGNAGVFPVANLGRLSWIGPWWWWKDEGGETEARGLFPLATFGEVSYAGPAWWSEDGWGLFPLFGAGFFGVNHVGPWIWEPEGDTYGLVPVFLHADGGRQLAVVPFYVHDLREDSETRYYLMGLGRTRRTEDLRESWVLPVWYSRREGDRLDRLLFPLFYRRERGDEERVFTLLGDSREAPEGSSLALYPLWWSSRSEDRAWHALLPLWYWERDGDARTLLTPLGGRGWSTGGDTRFVNVLGPLYHHSRTEDGSESRTAFLWPLFERSRRGEETTTRALPFFTHRRTPKVSETWYALGLGHAREEGEGSSWRLFPLASVVDGEPPDLLYYPNLFGHRSEDGETRSHLFPLYAARDAGDESHRHLLLGLAGTKREGGGGATWGWPLFAWSEDARAPGLSVLALFARERWDEGSTLTVGTPLVYRSWDEEGFDGGRSSGTFLLTLFSRTKEVRDEGYVPRGGDSREDWIERETTGFLFESFRSVRGVRRDWPEGLLTEHEALALALWSSHYRWDEHVAESFEPGPAREVLRDHGVRVPDDAEGAELAGIVRDFARRNTVLEEHREVRVPLLFAYERSGDATEWNGPLWIVDHESDAGSASTSVLWYGYRSETRNGRTTRDVFPFVTWDTGPEETTVSFLWRLFRYEREGDRTGGYLFFVPWGDV